LKIRLQIDQVNVDENFAAGLQEARGNHVGQPYPIFMGCWSRTLESMYRRVGCDG